MSNSLINTIEIITKYRYDSKYTSLITDLTRSLTCKGMLDAQTTHSELFFKAVVGNFFPIIVSDDELALVVQEMTNMAIAPTDSESSISVRILARLDRIRKRENSENCLSLCGIFLGRMTLFCSILKTFFRNPIHVQDIDKVAGRKCYNIFMEAYSLCDPEAVINHLISGSIPLDTDTLNLLFDWDNRVSCNILSTISSIIDCVPKRVRDLVIDWIFLNPVMIQHINIAKVLPYLIPKCNQEHDYSAILCAVTPEQVKEYGGDDLSYILDQWVNNTEDLPVILLMRSLQTFNPENETSIPMLVCHILKSDTTDQYSKYIKKERVIEYCYDICA